MNYVSKTKPYEHQQKMFEQLVEEDRSEYGIFWEMGLGKSKLIVDYAGSLFLNKKINSLLIIAPKGVYRNWVDQIDLHLSEDIKREVLVWQPNWTKKFTSTLVSLATPKLCNENTLRCFIMNVEALSSIKGAEICSQFLSLNKTLLVIDESTTIKNHKANRTKNLLKASTKAPYRFILTGSPVTNSPLDLFSQMKFLGFDFGNFYAFKNRYAVLRRQNFGGRPFDQIVGYQRLDELSKRIQPLTSRLLKNDCLDLPEKIYLTREVLLSKEQEKHYKEMKALALTMLESGELSTSASALTTLIRLQQIALGFAKTDDGELIDIPNNRLSELMQVLSEAEGKVVIYCTFRHSIKQIETEIIKQYGQDSVCTYFGDTKSEKRQEVINDFQNPDSKLRFFVGQISTAGYGITLTQSSLCLFFSNSFNLADRIQAEDRLHRIGQSKSVTYVDFISPKTIDVKIIKALRSKIDIASTVLGESLKEWLEI